ncbi:MAG: aldolase/citrate lyase family protein [Sneathiellaceae bacterium]
MTTAPKNGLQQIWAEGRPAVNAWLAIPSSLSAEVMVKGGWDSVTVDMQHGMAEPSEMLRMLGPVAAAGIVPMARVPWNEPGPVMRALDAGALGVICPMIETGAQAAAFVGHCLYPPKGHRSWGPLRARLLWGDGYAAAANDIVLPIAMVETKQGLDNLAEIAATPGLAALYVGPSDLSISLGYGPGLDRTEKEPLAAIDTILKAATANGIACGIQCGTAAYARKMAKKGFRLLTVGTDAGFLEAGASAAVQAFRK